MKNERCTDDERRVNIYVIEIKIQEKTHDIFDVNMFEKSGSMRLKSSDLYIFYREETDSGNTSLYLIYSFIQNED